MSRIARGFTLVELMVIVAIMGILAAIAIPVYNGYVIRSRVTEGLLVLSQCREIVSEIYQLSEVGFTVANNQWGWGENTPSTEYISLVTTNVHGVVKVTFRNLGAPTSTEKQCRWFLANWIPSECRQTSPTRTDRIKSANLYVSLAGPIPWTLRTYRTPVADRMTCRKNTP